MSNEWQDFLITIRSAGMEPPVFIIPGKIHRFPGEGKNHSNRAGRCRLFDDGLGGCFGDFSSGLSRSWQAKRNQNYNASEILAFKRKLAETRERNRQDHHSLKLMAAESAKAIWKEAAPASKDHAYLLTKSICANNARLHKGNLVLPMTDFSGTIRSLQFIWSNGEKRFLRNGEKQGCPNDQ